MELEDPDAAVFAARKAAKKARAGLRLAQGAMREGPRRHALRRLRAAGRRLGARRDRAMIAETAAGLAAFAQTEAETAALAAVAQALQARRAAADADPRAFAHDCAAAATDLAKARAHIAGADMRPKPRAAMQSAYAAAYAAARAQFRDAFGGADAEVFHDWRKRVKDVCFATAILRPLWPVMLEPAVEEMRRLARLIGEDHDLAVLADALTAEAAACGGPATAKRAVRVITRRSDALRRAAYLAGGLVFAEEPDAFDARCRAYWRVRRQARRAAA